MIPHDAGKPDPSSSYPLPHSPRDAAPIAGRVGEPVAFRPMPPSGPLPPALAAAPDVWSLLAALRHRWISAVILGSLLGALTAAGVWLLLTPRNTGFAKIQVAFTIDDFANRPGRTNDFKTVLSTTAGRIMSRPVIHGALKRDEVRRLNLESREADPVQMIEDDLRVEFKDTSEILTILFSHADPQIATVIANAIKEAFMEEYVYADSQRKATRVSELDKAVSETSATLRTKKESLRNRLSKDLNMTDPSLVHTQRLEALTNLREARNQQSTVQFKLIEARAQLDVFDARVRAMKTRSESPDAYIPKVRVPKPNVPAPLEEDIEAAVEQVMEKEPKTRRLQEQLSAAEGEIAEFKRKRFNPEYISYSVARDRAETTRRQLAEARAVIDARVRKQLANRHAAAVSAAARDYKERYEAAQEDAIEKAKAMPGARPAVSDEEAKVLRVQLANQINRLEKYEESLKKDIEEQGAIAARAPAQAIEYEQLVSEIKNDEAAIGRLQAQLAEERLAIRSAPRIAKLQDAELMKKDNKKQLLATLVAPFAVAGAVAGSLALVEHRKRKVRSAGEISRGLGIRVVGAVPRQPNLERQLVGPTGESELEGTPVMESIDAIRTRLLHEAAVRSTRVVMVTSATAGEGKTTLAAALASSLARAGRKTLLLDGDLRRPTLHELFEMPMQPGFSEVLLGEIEVAEAAVESPQENLSLLPAGQWDREVLLALARDGLEGAFEKLAEEFDFIVVDSHPVLSATDSLLLGRQADAVVLSVLREVSQMPKVYSAYQQLTGLGIRVLGAVVSGTNPEEVYTAAPTPVAVA